MLTGLGIGGMLSCTNAVVAEFSNNKWRSLCISIMVIGYPLGGGFGGLYASSLIARYDWRAVFYLGATATAILLPISFFLVPESVHWLTRKQPANVLERINRSLSKALGHAAITAMPEINMEERKKTLGDIFSPALIGVTLIVTSSYFLHIVSFYFLLKWAPKIITDMGFAASQGGKMLTFGNFGGAAGGAVFGLLTARFGLKPLTIVILVLNSHLDRYSAARPIDLQILMTIGFVVGFFGNAAVSGLYSIVAYAFPTHVRATGTGFVIGIGRGGAVISVDRRVPLADGEHAPGGGYVYVRCVGSLLAAGMLAFLKLGKERPVTVTQEKAQGALKPSTA